MTGCVTRTMSDWCRRYRRKFHRSRGAILRPGFAQSLPLHAVRGAERRQALVRIAAPRGPPRGRTDPWIARDHRPMTLAGAPLGAPPRHFWRNFRSAAAPGRASGNRHWRRPVQRAPRRAVLMPPGSLPGAARVRGYEPRPQGPHPAPSAERLRKTPLSERGDGNMYKYL
jgi:hypothetical protein